MPVLLGLCTDAAANQPTPEHDVCDPVSPGDTILEARILSFEQARYTCSPGHGGTQSGLDALLRPTAASSCVFADMLRVEFDPSQLIALHAIAGIPRLIEVRVDGVPRTLSYSHNWAICGLAPGHHAIEIDTDLGPLTCEGEVRAGENLSFGATSDGVLLHIEPTRLVAGVPRPGQRLVVEYDELNIRSGPRYMTGRRLDRVPPSVTLRLWTSPDGVLHAERCPGHPAATQPPPPSNVAPRTVTARGCAHCEAGDTDPSESMVVGLVVLALVVGKRSGNRYNRCS